MKIVILESQLKSIINEQRMGGSETYMTPEERFYSNPEKFWDVYVTATDQQIPQIDKNIYVSCYNKDKFGNYYTVQNCKEIKDYNPTDSARIFTNGRVIVQDKKTLKLKKKGTMKIIDTDHFRINWDDGSAVEKKSDPNWTRKGSSNNNSYNNSGCATSFDELKKGSGKLLQKGCKSNTVKELQKMLGMEQKFQTGFFGDITKNKVIEFQKTHKDDKGNQLKPDGIVGEKTYGSLKSS